MCVNSSIKHFSYEQVLAVFFSRFFAVVTLIVAHFVTVSDRTHDSVQRFVEFFFLRSFYLQIYVADRRRCVNVLIYDIYSEFRPTNRGLHVRSFLIALVALCVLFCFDCFFFSSSFVIVLSSVVARL